MEIRGSHTRVHAILKVVWAFAICLEITATSGPLGEIICTKAVKTGIINRNTMLPVILNTLWATAVRFAFLDCPIDARSAVMVVPMLSPKRIGIAPARPITLLTPSGPAWDAKFWSTAIVAELDWTTRVIRSPTSTPSTGTWDTFPIRLIKKGLPARGFITLPIISIPSNSSPKEKITRPIFFSFSDFPAKFIRNPMKIMG